MPLNNGSIDTRLRLYICYLGGMDSSDGPTNPPSGGVSVELWIREDPADMIVLCALAEQDQKNGAENDPNSVGLSGVSPNPLMQVKSYPYTRCIFGYF